LLIESLIDTEETRLRSKQDEVLGAHLFEELVLHCKTRIKYVLELLSQFAVIAEVKKPNSFENDWLTHYP
jgi:hypothetical protein